ncbi:CaiB/BaiF CoA transferase family protein [Streptomyces sp. KL116D]|uniref:CaiB/BaiF CoA transferase family protein n=1 Tax=Streptomyces sp. KL116D TaxID=3045152 RepID=UPI00355690F2
MLDGIRVVDVSRVIAGPFATRILADLGAEVIKVEQPGSGDETRAWIRGDIAGEPTSPAFATFNPGKKSIALNLKHIPARDALVRLAESADVFIHNFRPGVVEQLGIDADTLRARNPRLVYCGISGFGETGPLARRPGNDVIAQAYGGLMGMLGEPGRPPVRCVAPVGDLNAGYNAVVGILGALLGRERSGTGATISTSLYESVMGMMGHYLTDYLATGEAVGRLGSRNRFAQPNQAFPTADGYVVVSAVNDAMWRRAAAALDAPELADDPKFATQPERVANQGELIRLMEGITRRRPSAHWVDSFDRADVLCAPIQSIDAVVTDEQARELGILTETQTENGETRIPIVARQYQVDGERGQPGRLPGLGEHTAEVLGELGYTAAEIDLISSTGPAC